MGTNNTIKSLGIVASLALSFLFWFIPSGSLFVTFMPRSRCMFGNQNLITMHLISDAAIGIAYFIIAVSLFHVYRIVKEKQIPLKGFTWMFGIFIMFCGLTHIMGVLNLYVTYYWLDGAIKVICAIFSGFTAVNIIEVPDMIKDTISGEKYRELLRENKEIRERLDILETKRSI